MRRRRTKPRVAWLPVLGTSAGIEGVDPLYGGESSLVGDTNEIQWDAQPVTFDQAASAEVVQQNTGLTGLYPRTLADLVSGNAYRLRRLVGKCNVFVASATGATAQNERIPFVEVGAGFIVCKTDDDGNPTTDFNFVNPLQQDSAEDPWIWHRRWLLGTTPGYEVWADPRGATSIGAYSASGQQPSTNAGFGSAVDGPHIDQKTARVISPSERLFFVWALKGWDPYALATTEAAVSVQVFWHVRVVGSLRRMGGNRRNASR